MRSGAASFLAHLLLLLLLSQIASPDSGGEWVREIRSWVVEDLDELEPPPPVVTLVEPADEPLENAVSAAVMSTAADQDFEAELLESVEPTETEQTQVEVTPLEMLSAVALDEVVVQNGTVGEQVANVEGAVDRITHEIAIRMATSDVLVVWMMDASVSLIEDRSAVADRLQRVYDEIAKLDTVRDEALLGAVVAFGEKQAELVAPTSDGAKVVQAIREVPTDNSGVENVFSAIVATVNRYKQFRTQRKHAVMLVIWTDESGNDVSHLEEAADACRRLAIPVFTVGPSAAFGRVQMKVSLRNPADDLVYLLPVDRGPDSFQAERIRLPYWFDGEQLEQMHAGLGPFGLTRMARQTGGAYFINDRPRERSPFQLDVMRRYMPDYGSSGEYQQGVRNSRLRQAVMHAVEVTHAGEMKDTPRLSFEPTGANFQQELREAQETVAYNAGRIDEALAPFEGRGMDDEYAAESSPRWRAWYDLTLGRLLAMKVRCDQYNRACAEMKGKGADFVDKQSNRWTFEPDEEIRFNTAAQTMAEQAVELLQRCVRENPGTPWEMLAQRELRHPLGIRVNESYVKPEPPPDGGRPGNERTPQGRREEQLRKIQRAKPADLPKL